jgi:hypothetical protein
MEARTTVLITAGPFPECWSTPPCSWCRSWRGRRRAIGRRHATEVLATEWAEAPRQVDALLAEIEPDLRRISACRARAAEVGLAPATPAGGADAAGVCPWARHPRWRAGSWPPACPQYI